MTSHNIGRLLTPSPIVAHFSNTAYILCSHNPLLPPFGRDVIYGRTLSWQLRMKWLKWMTTSEQGPYFLGTRVIVNRVVFVNMVNWISESFNIQKLPMKKRPDKQLIMQCNRIPVQLSKVYFVSLVFGRTKTWRSWSLTFWNWKRVLNLTSEVSSIW